MCEVQCEVQCAMCFDVGKRGAMRCHLFYAATFKAADWWVTGTFGLAINQLVKTRRIFSLACLLLYTTPLRGFIN